MSILKITLRCNFASAQIAESAVTLIAARLAADPRVDSAPLIARTDDAINETFRVISSSAPPFHAGNAVVSAVHDGIGVASIGWSTEELP